MIQRMIKIVLSLAFITQINIFFYVRPTPKQLTEQTDIKWYQFALILNRKELKYMDKLYVYDLYITMINLYPRRDQLDVLELAREYYQSIPVAFRFEQN